jgi:DNA polymerase (family 10)
MTDHHSNSAISDLLDRHGRLLEVAGESPFRRRAYTRAAEAIRVYPEPVAVLAADGRLRDIEGVGEGIAAAIDQILRTGHFAAHDELTAQLPESLIDLMAIPGVGAKTVQRLFTSLGVDSIPALEAALAAGRISAAKGLGVRAEATIRSGLESLQRRTGRTPLGIALPLARAFISAYSLLRPRDKISLAGSARRWQVTIGDLDFVVATNEFESALATLGALPMVSAPQRASESTLHLSLAGGIEADVFLTEADAWGSTLVRATGSALHLEKLGSVPELAASEEEVYAAHGLPWIPPELRQGHTEFLRWADIPSLIALPDINGEFHAHTTWSDGAAGIAEMAAAAAGRGYEFLGITDHSHGLGVAGGLDAERLLAQRIEIAESNRPDNVLLLAGAEVEVHKDGSLDFSPETLADLDVVVASLHTGLRQPRAELTERLVRVLDNPDVDIIAHPSGRLIERREGGDFDWDRVFEVAARTGTALEINADPARLDLDPDHARHAHDAGCLITINSDAHHPAGFAVMEYGVMMARRAWLKPEDVLNAWSRERILDWLAARRTPS